MDRGVDLNDGASEAAIRAFEKHVAASLTQAAQDLFLACDGFHLSEEDQMLSLWPLGEILQKSVQPINVANHELYAIGDLWMNANFIMASLTDETSPVVLFNERKTMANNFAEFLERLVAGELTARR